MRFERPVSDFTVWRATLTDGITVLKGLVTDPLAWAGLPAVGVAIVEFIASGEDDKHFVMSDRVALTAKLMIELNDPSEVAELGPDWKTFTAEPLRAIKDALDVAKATGGLA